MEQVEQLVKHMIDETTAELKNSGEYELYGEAGVRMIVYENIHDNLKIIFSDIIY